MFVEWLNDKQQAALLHYAHEMMVADGVLEAKEQVYMDGLRKQIRPGVEAKPLSIDELASTFDRRSSRIALYLELTGMGYANQNFDPRQSDILRKIAEVLTLSNNDVEAVNSWVVALLQMMKRARNLMVET